MGPDQTVWALRITARDRYSDRCWAWGEPLGIAMEGAVDRSEGRWSGAMKPDIEAGQNDKLVEGLHSASFPWMEVSSVRVGLGG